MNRNYISPKADILCFIPLESLAAIAPINLLDGSTGLGSAAKSSEADIRINL